MNPTVAEVRLRDGTRVFLRPIRPEDAARVPDFEASVSAESRRLRFHSTVAALTPRMVAAATHVDYTRDMALVATVHENGAERPLGVGRYSRLPDGTTAVFAIVVSDASQGRGLGEALMRRLRAAARVAGITQTAGWVLAHTPRLLAMCRRLAVT